MNRSHYFISAFGTFGNPNGFRQSYWFTEDRTIATGIKTFDLNTNAIKIFPQTKVYAIRKEYVNGHNTLGYSVYTHVKERNSDRSGTFIGSSILFVDRIAEESSTISCLNEFHDDLVSNNVRNTIIEPNHSDNFKVKTPTDFDQLKTQLRDIENLNFSKLTNKQLVVYSDTKPDILQCNYKKAVNLLHAYDTIYFTSSREVAEFVKQKGLFSIMTSEGFEISIQKVEEEKLQKIQTSLDEFTIEKQKLEEDRKRLNEEYNKEIDRNINIQLGNEEIIRASKADLDKLNHFYAEFYKSIDALSNKLHVGEEPQEIRDLYNENKRLFIEGMSKQQKPTFINALAKPKIKTALKVTPKTASKPPLLEVNYDGIKNIPQITIYKGAAFAFLALWIGTLMFLYFFNKAEPETVVEKETQEVVQDSNVNESTVVTEEIEIPSIQALNPEPNGELNENDYRLVANQLPYNTPVSEVVKLIFARNPTDIRNTYKGQESIYMENLIHLNKDCFEDRDGTFYFVKGTITHIPSYRK